MTFYKDGDNQNKWWIPSTALTSTMKAPYLLAIPNAVVEILRKLGGASMPADVLGVIDAATQTIKGGVTKDQWSTVTDWCLLAGQADENGKKSLLSIEVDLVAIDDKEFDVWVGGKLDVALGPHPMKTPQVAMANQPPMQDYLQMLRLLASTVGQGMMQFSQAVAMQATTGGTATLGQATPLESSKGFDRDQIAKLKDECGMMSAKDIPHIWYVIQTTRRKAYDTYQDHLKKSIEAWCRSRHIQRDKSIYLKAQFFDDLAALRFNPGGPVAQYKLATRGILMLAC